jgi:hypothetical protein
MAEGLDTEGAKAPSSSVKIATEKEVVVRALEKIEKSAGILTANAVVEAAQDERHVLHSYFEWDNSVAGLKYRLDQARGLIRNYKVTVVRGETQITMISVFVRDVALPQKEQGYMRAVELAEEGNEEDLRLTMIAEGKRVLGNANRWLAVALLMPESDPRRKLVLAAQVACLAALASFEYSDATS